MGLFAIWHEGDRVEIHGVSRWDGKRGRVSSWQGEASPGWVPVAVDDQEGAIFGFRDHELTRINDD